MKPALESDVRTVISGTSSHLPAVSTSTLPTPQGPDTADIFTNPFDYAPHSKGYDDLRNTTIEAENLEEEELLKEMKTMPSAAVKRTNWKRRTLENEKTFCRKQNERSNKWDEDELSNKSNDDLPIKMVRINRRL